MFYYPRATDTNADYLLCLADTMEGTGHKWIIPRGIGKYHQLGTAQGILIPGQLSGTLDDLTHLADAVHIDARLGGAKVYRGAYHIGGSQSLRDGIQQDLVAVGKALFNQGRKAANKVYAYSLGCLVQSLCYRYVGIGFAGFSGNGNRSNGNTFMNNRNTVLGLNVLAGFYQKLSRLGNLVVDIAAELVNIRMSTVTEGNAHGNGADIQLVLRNHAVGF